MFIKFDPSLHADLVIDIEGVVHGINHFKVYMSSDQLNTRLAAIDYIRQVADVIDVPKSQLARAHQQTSYLDSLTLSRTRRLCSYKQLRGIGGR